VEGTPKSGARPRNPTRPPPRDRPPNGRGLRGTASPGPGPAAVSPPPPPARGPRFEKSRAPRVSHPFPSTLYPRSFWPSGFAEVWAQENGPTPRPARSRPKTVVPPHPFALSNSEDTSFWPTLFPARYGLGGLEPRSGRVCPRWGPRLGQTKQAPVAKTRSLPAPHANPDGENRWRLGPPRFPRASPRADPAGGP